MHTLSFISKSIIIVLPFISSLVMFLVLLNISIWIYDESRIRQAIKKSKKVLYAGLIFFTFIALLVFIFQSVIFQ